MHDDHRTSLRGADQGPRNPPESSRLLEEFAPELHERGSSPRHHRLLSQSRLLVEADGEIQALDGLTRGALHQVVET